MKAEKDKVIIIGGTRKIKDNITKKCDECGKKTTISGDNIKRAEQKDVKILCPDCGTKTIKIKGDEKIVYLPSEADMDKFLDKYVGEHVIKKFIVKTVYCKKCNTEFGHELVNGAMMINKTKVGFKDPEFSKELADIKVVVKREQDAEEPPPTSTQMVA